jgi:hypothetical protein
MNNLLRPNQFAKKVGKSRQAISQAIQSGLLPTKEIDGIKYIDLTDQHIIAYIDSVVPTGKKTHGIKKSVGVKELKKPGKAKAVKVKSEKSKEKETSSDDLPADLYDRLDAGQHLTNKEVVDMPKQWIEKIKLYEMTKQIQQKRQQERKELINKKALRITLGKLFEIHTNEFLTLKSKIIPDLSSVFGNVNSEKIIEAEKIVDEESWKVLKHIKIEFNKFLDRYNADPIE